MSRSFPDGKWLVIRENFMDKDTEVLHSSSSVRMEQKEMSGNGT